MRIEVATSSSDSNKTKGDLLEKLAERVITRQNYKVTAQIRKTASELDLTCKHNVSNRTVYAECKAHRDPLSANVLKNLLGELVLHEFDEAWLISTGSLGKDAKGFVDEWNKKPADESNRMSFYTSDKIVDMLCTTSTIVPQPTFCAEQLTGSVESLGDWTLLITQYGMYWCVIVTESGVPAGVLVFNAKTGEKVTDLAVLRRIGNTDTTLSNLDFEYLAKCADSGVAGNISERIPKVVQVQAGEDWADYRPARPEHFVGRTDAQDRLIKLLESIRTQETLTRIFAITGDSGMGKSSLIAKLRARCANVRNRRKYFIFAVDVRAATDPSYIHASLLAALSKVSEEYSIGSLDLKVSDYTDPLSSPSITQLLQHLEDKKQVVCIVFDQFEELYSKPDLFAVFQEALRLFLSAVTASSSIALGFAWKSDSSVQQGHPAYFMWHRLSDYRFEIGLSPFSHSEASSALTLFEKVIGTKVRPELRRQVIENSQGFPWLIKKLCLHLWEQIQQGISQEELEETLDVASLFDRDIQSLTTPESTCLRAVARTAPSDWYDVIDTYGEEVLRSLQQRRLVVRSGDRLNVYWDIFKDYLLTNSVPSLPFTYLPSSPSIRALLDVATQLDHNESKSIEKLVKSASIKESTAQNVIHDLIMFGVARGTPQSVSLDERVESSNEKDVLLRIRDVLRRHALTRLLKSNFDHGETIYQEEMIETLRSINRAAQHSTRTWNLYADRMGRWLVSTGLAFTVHGGWQVQDRGDVQIPSGRKRRDGTFIGDAPPHRTIEALTWLLEKGSVTRSEVKQSGMRNAFAVLTRFELIESSTVGEGYEAVLSENRDDPKKAVWIAAHQDKTLSLVLEYLDIHPLASGRTIGIYINEISEGKWSNATKLRVGNGLRKWAIWLKKAERNGLVPEPPKDETRKVSRRKSRKDLPTLFE